MTKPWQEITDDELLDYERDQTATIARYERIMAKRTTDALGQVWAGLFDVKKALHHVSDKLDDRLKESAIAQQATAKSQSRLQWAAVGLSVVIAVSTVVYTWITWQSVQAQREANQIQRDAQNKK